MQELDTNINAFRTQQESIKRESDRLSNRIAESQTLLSNAQLRLRALDDKAKYGRLNEELVTLRKYVKDKKKEGASYPKAQDLQAEVEALKRNVQEMRDQVRSRFLFSRVLKTHAFYHRSWQINRNAGTVSAYEKEQQELMEKVRSEKYDKVERNHRNLMIKVECHNVMCLFLCISFALTFRVGNSSRRCKWRSVI